MTEQWAYSLDGENFQDCFEAKEDALTDGAHAAHDREEGTVWVAKTYRPSPSTYMPEPLTLWQGYVDHVSDELAGADWAEVDISNEDDVAFGELKELLATWANKHIKLNFWLVEHGTVEEHSAADVLYREERRRAVSDEA